MPTSRAKIEANAANAKKSTGPRTAEGKEKSRLNALKHGLTGEGVALPDEDAREIDARFDLLRRQMKPRSGLGAILLRRICFLSLRLDRAMDHETAMLKILAQTAEVRHVEERLGEMDQLLAEIAETPWTNARRLRECPEGVDRMLVRLGGIRAALQETKWEQYDQFHYLQFDGLMGNHAKDIPSSRVKGLSYAMFGSVSYLERGETEGWDQDRRKAWARSELITILDAEAIQLEQRRKEVASKAATLTAPQAIKAAKFDPSKEATLARKYEAATERAFYRAIREFREAEDQYDGIEDETPEDANLDPQETSATVGSFLPVPAMAPDRAASGPASPPDSPPKPGNHPVDAEPRGPGGGRS